MNLVSLVKTRSDRDLHACMSHLSSLSLSFLICEMGIKVTPQEGLLWILTEINLAQFLAFGRYYKMLAVIAPQIAYI